MKDVGVHIEVKSFVLKHSEESFIDFGNFINPEKSHIGEKRYVCKQCGKTYQYALCFEN